MVSRYVGDWRLRHCAGDSSSNQPLLTSPAITRDGVSFDRSLQRCISRD
ncbi:hypothetical protein [Micromonospora marina]